MRSDDRIISTLLGKQADVITPLEPHQQRVVDKLQRGNVLVAHGMGSGKTLTSIAAAEKLGLPTEVRVPAPLVGNYLKEITKHTGGKIVPYNVESMVTAAKRGTPVAPGSFLVVDEAHALRNTGTERLAYMKDRIENAKRVAFLTGTPVYNRPSDIAPVINLLKGEQALPENPTEFDKQFIDERKVQPGFVGWILGMKPGIVRELKNQGQLRKTFKGFVDVHVSQKDFPKRVDEDINVGMSPKQQDIYDYLEGRMPFWIRWKVRMGLPPSKAEARGLNAFLAGVRQASDSPGPYVAGMTPLESARMSPKIMKAVENLKVGNARDPNFKGFVYSNYLEAALHPMSAALSEAGIPHALFHGGLSKPERDKIVQDYNAGKIKVILGSSSASEGLDLKGTKILQVLEPHFNESKIDQVIARAIRFRSHHHLPEKEREVKVQRFFANPRQPWTSFITGKREGVDQWLLQRAEEKERLGAELLKIMKDVT